MSEETVFTAPDRRGEFRLVRSDGIDGCRVCAAKPNEILCETTPCGVRFHLELIPGTDAPAERATPELALIVAGDRIRVLEAETAEWFQRDKAASARIVELEAKIAAMESAKPVFNIARIGDVIYRLNPETGKWIPPPEASRPPRCGEGGPQ